MAWVRPDAPWGYGMNFWYSTSHYDRTAAHEAGHALLAWHSRYVVSVQEAHMTPFCGKTIYAMLQCPNQAEMLWDHVTIGLAGIAAEVIAFRNVRSGTCVSDLRDARDRAEELIQRCRRPNPPWPDDAPPSSIDIGLMFSPPPDYEIRLILNVSYRRARSVIMRRAAEFDRLRSELRQRSILDTAALNDILGPRQTRKN